MFNITNFRSKHSIIQTTLYKMTLSISLFLIAFWMLYGQNYWEKEALKTYGKLLLITSDVQSEIQSQINHIEYLTNKGNLTSEQKKMHIRELLSSVVENNRYNDLDFGYYDIKLDSILTNEELAINDIAYKIRATIGLKREFQNFTWDNDGVITVSLPIYDHGEIVGYGWASARNSDIVFNSAHEMSGIMFLVLGLPALFLVFVRKQMKQIRSYLEMFCKMIMDNDCDTEQIITKLPELKSVLTQITYYTDSLKHANEELKLSKLQTMKIMEGISDGFYALDREWRFTFVNHKIKIVTNTDSLVGESIWDVFPKVIDSITYHKMHEAMSQNESVHWEAGGLTNPHQNHEYHAYPYREGLTVFFRDISELKRQQQELSRLERLNLIGQLAAGISHEIRNPLTSVKGFLQLFATKPQYEKDKEYMDLMISEIDRANTIITDFLSLAKANSDNIICQNLNEVINKVLPMLQADAYNNNKEVIVDLNKLPDIMINENEIKQLILNLVRNGLDATSEQGCVIISTFLKEDKVILAIKDQGNGIPQEIQEKIGTPFFTTKESGTGLGLAISIGIAQRHGAVFEFKTGTNGTVFYTIFST